jgi:hypothetical protein
MIDFRYHLVSLVSVFVALAVGIVLGAGPLRNGIADGLKAQVDSVSAQNKTLKDEKGTAEKGITNRDAFVREVVPALVGQQLTGRTVVLVTLPGSDLGAVKPLTQSIEAAGGHTTVQVDVKDAWTSRDTLALRQRLAERWKPVLRTDPRVSPPAQPTASPAAPDPSNPPTAGGTVVASAAAGSSSKPTPAPLPFGAVLEEVLAWALVRDGGSQPDSTAAAILDALSAEGLISVSGDPTGRASEAVLLAPPVEQVLTEAKATPVPSPTTDLTPTWTALAAALDDTSSGAVVVGPASSAEVGGVLAAVRAVPELAGQVSTVDTGGTPMGDVTTVFALREQLARGAGAYGFGRAAKAVMPTGQVAP